jgi:hypothetical protein
VTDHKKFLEWAERNAVALNKQPMRDGGCAYTFAIDSVVIGKGKFKVNPEKADITAFFDRSGRHYAGCDILWNTQTGWC